MAPAPERKLAVLLHADVVGSTALVQMNETLAHQRIQDTFRRFSATITSHGGTATEIRGDALVAEFSRASDSVSAAIAFQAQNIEHNANLNDEIRPEIRVGISLGEVVVADGTVTGAGVVLAQRLEQLAPPNGVVVQGSVSETVPDRMPFDFDSLGEQTLKGFERPVRAFVVRLKPDSELPGAEGAPSATVLKEAAADPVEERPPLELPDEPSIAVLPFTNMSGDPEQEFFSDGITEDIITALSRISGLLVVARNSTMVYKGKAVDVKQVGREQGVRYVLEGSVRKGGNRVRVSAQLIDATTGHHQWADRYDRELDDIFAVQDEITRRITVEMHVQLEKGEQARVWASGTKNVEAWEKTIHGMKLYATFVREDNFEARRLAQAAIAIDPNFAQAWTLLGWTNWTDVIGGWTASREETLKEAQEHASRALNLANDDPSALALLGEVLWLGGEREQALDMLEKAVGLAPNNATLTANLGNVLFFDGRIQESVDKIKRAMRLSPIYPAWYLALLGAGCHLMEEHEFAIECLIDAVQREPDSALCKLWLAQALVECDRSHEAKLVARDIMRVVPGFSVTRWEELRFKDPSMNGKVIKNLLRAGLPE